MSEKLVNSSGADMLENLLYTYRQFITATGMEPNAWIMHPSTWQATRSRLLQYTMGGIEARGRELPVFPVVNESPLHPPSLMGHPVVQSIGITEGTILAARVEF